MQGDTLTLMSGAVATVSAAILSVGWKIYKRRKHAIPKETAKTILVETASGDPACVVLVGPDGREICTDKNGIAIVPESWIGNDLTVYSGKDRKRALIRTPLLPSENGSMKITVPNDAAE